MGDLKMAAAKNDALLNSDPGSRQSGVNILFVDEDELPLAYLTEHRVSEDEFLADESESSQEESDEQDTDEEMDEDVEENGWSEDINRREDVDFQEVGINVDFENLGSCLDFFLLFFTEEVWQFLVKQTNLYAGQKRGPEESSVWYPVTRDEMKAWASLYLNVGLITKPNLSSYWSTDPALSSPFSLP